MVSAFLCVQIEGLENLHRIESFSLSFIPKPWLDVARAPKSPVELQVPLRVSRNRQNPGMCSWV